MKKMSFFLLILLVFFNASLGAEDTTSEEYIVEKDDTMWDISDTKLEDPFLWPKLWNVNPHIENPDLIYPGSKIIIPSREELMRLPVLPVKKIPVARKQKIEKPKPVFEFPEEYKQKYIISRDLFIASGWISDRYPGIGEITYSPMNRKIIGKNDIAYLKINEEAMSEKRYFAIRDIRVVIHPITGKRLGHQIRVTGLLSMGLELPIYKASL
jgi:hypothetical protein